MRDESDMNDADGIYDRSLLTYESVRLSRSAHKPGWARRQALLADVRTALDANPRVERVEVRHGRVVCPRSRR